MSIYRKASNFLVLCLIGIALWVFIGKAYDKGMWLEIALYWAVLTFKNLCDFLNIAHEKKEKENADD